MAAKGIEHHVEHYHQRAIQEQEPQSVGTARARRRPLQSAVQQTTCDM
jgi:hypothetical protein